MIFKLIDELKSTDNRKLTTDNYDCLRGHFDGRMVVACGLITFSLICSAMGQAPKLSDASEVASPTSQTESQSMSTNVMTPPEETKTSSSNEEKNKASDDPSATNAASSNAELNTNGVVPTDPSMIPPPESTSADNPTNTSLPIDPNAVSATEAPSEQASPVNSTESVEKKKHEIKVRYNEVRTQVEKEEAVVALRQAADKETTIEGQRQTLRAYYELLFKRMKQVDPSLTERCDVMQGAYLRRVEQTGAEPTIPLHLLSGVETNSTNAQQGAPPSKKQKLHKKTSTSNTSQ